MFLLPLLYQVDLLFSIFSFQSTITAVDYLICRMLLKAVFCMKVIQNLSNT